MTKPFSLFGEELFGADAAPTAASLLASRFLIPPFSVLEARSGSWQERKRAWLALGIKSELGRDGGNTWAKGHRGDPVGAKIIASNGASDGTSIFDPVLCELAYRWFCPERGHVLDPFAGGSVRGVVAVLGGREYTGIDIRAEQVEANREQAATICKAHKPSWVNGDALDAIALTRGMAADFLFSCPPYGDLEVYSDHPRDLSTMSWLDFVTSYRKAIAAAVSLLKPDRFAAFLVGDFRNKAGVYRNFPGVTIEAFEAAGTQLYNEAILVPCVGSLSLRAGRQFSISRKLGKAHQNFLVFVKGDPRKAAAACERAAFELADEAA